MGRRADVMTAPVLTVAMMYSDLVPEYLHGDIWFFLFTRVPLIALAGVGLAIFSTARTAGPMVKLKRVFEDVTRGNMDSRLAVATGRSGLSGTREGVLTR